MARSFFFGVLLGLVPVFIGVRVCVRECWRREESVVWDDRWFLYGRSLGFFLLVTVAVLIVIVNFT